MSYPHPQELHGHAQLPVGHAYDPTALSAGPGYAVYPAPVKARPTTNGMSIASLVLSIVGAFLLCAYGIGGVVGVVGAILGHVARGQIRERGEAGDGMALAGIIVGWIAGALGIVAGALIVLYLVWQLNALA